MESATPRSALAAAYEQPYSRPVDEQRQHRSRRKQQREPTRVRQLLAIRDRVIYDAVLGRGGGACGGRALARGRGHTSGRACSGGTVPGCRTRRGSRGSVCSGWAAGSSRGGTACGSACPGGVTVAEVGRFCGLVDRYRLPAIMAEGYLPLIPARSGTRTRGLARGSAGGRAICAGGPARGRARGLAIIQLRQAKEDLVLGYVADLIGDLGGRILDFILADAVLLGDLLSRA